MAIRPAFLYVTSYNYQSIYLPPSSNLVVLRVACLYLYHPPYMWSAAGLPDCVDSTFFFYMSRVCNYLYVCVF